MKEISIEEKVKRYDEALDRARKELQVCGSTDCDATRQIFRFFPELKGSESERIRKSLLEYLHTLPNHYAHSGVCAPEWIAWLEKQDIDISSFPKEQQEFMLKYISLDKITLIKLLAERDANNAEIIESFEKQGEQKSINDLTQQEAMDIAVAKCFEQGEQKVSVVDFKAKDWYVSKVDGKIRNIHHSVDKIEPKFHEGEWIISDTVDKDYHICKIIGIKDGNYTIESIYGYKGYNQFDVFDATYKLWTIQDAKDGDVLTTEKGVFIYAKVLYGKPYAYCGVDKFGVFKDNCLKNNWTNSVDNIYPATQERREILFTKMKEAGYEWDAEKKELKKIERKLAWSEEMRKELISYLDNFTNSEDRELVDKFIAWLENQSGKKSFAKYKVGDTIYYNSFGRLVSFVIANIIEDGTDNPMYEDKDGNSVFQNDIVEQKPTNKQFTPEQADVLDKYVDKYLEQKPINKIEPKFKIGQTIKKEGFNLGFTIVKIKNDFYYNDMGDYFPFIDQDDWELVEQKPTDKVESKFHEGDWIVDNCGNVWKIEGILNQFYILEGIEGDESHPIIEWVDKTFHLWVIQDAKDGDILVTMDDERPFIYKGCLDSNHPDSPVAYCGINSEGYFQISGDKFAIWWTDMNVQPATKEQCDLLFQKMKEAGYEWDSEKKKLVEPKFHEGNWVVRGKTVAQIHDIQEQYYIGLDINGNDFTSSRFLSDDKIHLWTIQDAKDGDVLSDGTTIFIFKDLLSDGSVMSYCDYDTNSGESDAFCPLSVNLMCSKITPATKEQHDTLLKAMADAGYTFDFNKKELNKIEQPHAWSEDDERTIKRIDSLLHAINKSEFEDIHAWLKSLKERVQPRPKQELSEEDEHWRQKVIDFIKHPDLVKATPSLAKNTIAWLKSFSPQPKNKWSEEDENRINRLIAYFEDKESFTAEDDVVYANWLKLLKDRVQPRQEWKQENTDDLTDFENAMMHIGGSFFGENAALDPNDTNVIKEQANLLLELMPSKKWGEEDETMITNIIIMLKEGASLHFNKKDMLKGVNWLNSLRDRYTWKPSDEQMKFLWKYAEQNNCDGSILTSLYNDLKKLKG